jgi:alpha-glucosidase
MQFGEYINVINGVAHTYGTTEQTFKGIMGLTEQTSNNLFLPDGVFSLWSLDTANPKQSTTAPGSNMYGTHPYFMAQASDQSSWFGVFINNAAAQDWWIKNDATTGDVTVKTMAAGGVSDMYFFDGTDPNDATKSYHRIVGLPVVTPQWALGWH